MHSSAGWVRPVSRMQGLPRPAQTGCLQPGSCAVCFGFARHAMCAVCRFAGIGYLAHSMCTLVDRAPRATAALLRTPLGVGQLPLPWGTLVRPLSGRYSLNGLRDVCKPVLRRCATLVINLNNSCIGLKFAGFKLDSKYICRVNDNIMLKGNTLCIGFRST